MFNEYVDFEIQISPLSESRYAVSVSGPGGDASGALVLPTHDPTFQAHAERLARLDTDEETLAELGQMLFQAIFQGAIRDVYTRSQGMLTHDQALRLRLNIAPSEVAAIALLQAGNIYAFIEALDNAGNATIETGKGTLFALNQIFLPPIISR